MHSVAATSLTFDGHLASLLGNDITAQETPHPRSPIFAATSQEFVSGISAMIMPGRTASPTRNIAFHTRERKVQIGVLTYRHIAAMLGSKRPGGNVFSCGLGLALRFAAPSFLHREAGLIRAFRFVRFCCSCASLSFATATARSFCLALRPPPYRTPPPAMQTPDRWCRTPPPDHSASRIHPAGAAS